MSDFKKTAITGITKVAKLAVSVGTIAVLPILIPAQDLYQGAGSTAKVPEILKRNRGTKPIIVTDGGLYKLGLHKKVTDALEAAGMPYAIYHGVEPNPSIENIEEAYALYKSEGCDCIVAIGGGSSMDAAKVLAGRVVNPNRSTKDMGRLFGYFQVSLPNFKRIPYTITIPTTAGTGAESTMAAVVSDHAADKKYTITDPMMRPQAAILDPELATGLPKFQTAITAIDAVSHCSEGYIGGAKNFRATEYQERAVRDIFANIDTAINDPTNLEARAALSQAAYFGGQSLNMSATGYVHPFCHKIGAKYNLPHGRCIGAVMPIIFDAYMEREPEKVSKRLAKLGRAANLSDPNASDIEAANQYIQAIRDFDAKYGIEAYIPEIRDEDFEEIYKSIVVENFPYPTPVIFSKEEVFDLLRTIRGDYAAK